MGIIIILLKVALIACFCALYACGGQSWGKKWIRRFLAPGIFGAGLLLLALLAHQVSWWLVSVAWYCPSLLIFKYGVNDGKLWKKVLLRGAYGFSLGLPACAIGIANHHVYLGALQFSLAGLGSILFGVLNPFSMFGNLGVFLEDICIALCAVGLVPFLFK